MTILYIHGLNGSLSAEKRTILEQYGTVISPSIDYHNIPNTIEWLYDTYKNKTIDVIIGSSMGGFTGFHLCKLMQKPALLFNPALTARSVEQQTPNTPSNNGNNISMVLGAKDTVVDPKGTLNFIGDHLNAEQPFDIKILPLLEHRIPVDVFDEMVDSFFF
ncbi:YqiA/YcfP family alpha/beta fold hydrolase [Winogradskyella pulchriflava]|uniref:YqiA/YcfP family alpha/beta fold hydrolase n=1 Tax=Winogradskyella pulchriflava TaxID=1110688 RepID=A0ABV6Q7N8_9FLAO